MNLTEGIKSALSGIVSNKMRAILTMFGIVVGIASVIMITSIGEGYKVSMNREFETMGLDKVSINTDSGNGQRIEWEDLLTYDDVAALKKYDDIIEATASMGYGFGDAVELLDGEMATAFITGVDEAYYRMEKTIKFAHGRNITEQDVEVASTVTVISEDLALQKFGRTDCIGDIIEVNTWGVPLELTVIGVTKSDSASAMAAMFTWYQELYVPISLLQSVYNGGSNSVDGITIKVADTKRISEITENAIRIIEMNHGNEGKYSANSVADMMGEVDSVIGIFTMFMGIVAGISLLVGGIGVMNIMLVSVTERTREIGIRKSIGATDFNIQFQFLIEAVILTAIGGVVGMIFGYGGGKLFALVAVMVTGMSMEPFISWEIVGLVVAISAGIGIIFGVYPAAKAAKLDPIEALRFE